MGCYCEFLIPVGFCSTVLAKNAVSHKPFPLFSTRGAELSCHISGYVTSTPSINSLKRSLKTLFLLTLNQTYSLFLKQTIWIFLGVVSFPIVQRLFFNTATTACTRGFFLDGPDSRTQGIIVQENSGEVTQLNKNYLCFQGMSNISMILAEHKA